MKHIILSSLLAAGVIGTTASAAVTNIDFGRNDNTTGGNWNNVTGSGITLSTPSLLLTDDLGGATGITINTSFADGGSFAGSGADFGGPYPVVAPATAAGDSLYLTGAAFVTMTLTGLDAGSTYDLVLYGARGGSLGGNSSFDVTDNNGTTTDAISVNNLNSTDTASFTGLVPDGSNEITIKYYTTDAHSALNTMSITVVPEPGSLALLGLTGLGLLRRRRA